VTAEEIVVESIEECHVNKDRHLPPVAGRKVNEITRLGNEVLSDRDTRADRKGGGTIAQSDHAIDRARLALSILRIFGKETEAANSLADTFLASRNVRSIEATAQPDVTEAGVLQGIGHTASAQDGVQAGVQVTGRLI
jgi:hypothetical protein